MPLPQRSCHYQKCVALRPVERSRPSTQTKLETTMKNSPETDPTEEFAVKDRRHWMCDDEDAVERDRVYDAVILALLSRIRTPQEPPSLL